MSSFEASCHNKEFIRVYLADWLIGDTTNQINSTQNKKSAFGGKEKPEKNFLEKRGDPTNASNICRWTWATLEKGTALITPTNHATRNVERCAIYLRDKFNANAYATIFFNHDDKNDVHSVVRPRCLRSPNNFFKECTLQQSHRKHQPLFIAAIIWKNAFRKMAQVKSLGTLYETAVKKYFSTTFHLHYIFALTVTLK